jgi:drug/metabolite transporter (DMT)-like permease
MSQNRNTQGFLLMVHSALLFSFMGALAHYLGQYYDWKLVVFLRNFISFACSFALLGSFTFRSREYLNVYVWFRSLIGGFSVLFSFYALSHASISLVVAIMNTAPIWVAVIRRVVYKDEVSGMVWAMVFLGVTGVGLIEMPSLDEGYLPLLAANISALCSALVQISLHELADMDSKKVVFLFSLVATLISAALMAFVHPASTVHPALSVEMSGFFLGMGIFGYAGQMGMTRAFAIGHPTIVSVAILWNVVFAFLLDVLFFDRSFNWPTIAGVALIMLSSTAIKRR